MTDNQLKPPTKKQLEGWKLWIRGAYHLLLIVAILAGVLFASAGRLDWPAAWVLTLLYAFFLFIVMFWGFRNALDLMRERGKVASNVKSWDKLINTFYAILLLALLIIAGLDAGRYQWSVMPFVLQVLGTLGFLLSGAFIMWTMTENAYLSRWARIQQDRGQKVVTTGPYRFIRHPMYAAIILLMLCTPFELGSYWALVPGALIGVLYVIRTVLEDRMLIDELDGYIEYSHRVRYRLFPRIW